MAVTIGTGAAAPSRRIDRLAELARRRAAAFRTARRHSVAVRGLRWVLPAGVVGLVGAYGLALRPELSARIGSGELKGRVEITSDDLKMKNLSYAGATKDGGRYDVRAKEAAVDFARTGPVRLDHIDGDLTQQSGVVTKLKARRGTLDNNKGEMDLFDGIEIEASNGMKAWLKTAKVFNKDHRVVSKDRVIANTPTGHIEADAMDFETKARKGTFAGNVVVKIQQQDGAKAVAGLGQNAKGPLDVRSQKLDIDDAGKQALFSGGVTAQQGDSVLQSSGLKVVYEGKTPLPGQAAPSVDSAEGARVSALLASGNVVVTAGADRRIQSDAVEFDVKADRALFTGAAVEITQGKNRLAGRRLLVDRKSGRSSLSSPGEGRLPAGRIHTVFVQEQKPGTQPKAAKPATTDGGTMMSFRTDPNAPMDIQADTLDVNDPAKQAVYRGAVRAQQGEVVIQTPELIATYTGETGLMSDVQASARGQGAQVSRVDARQKVVITSASGEEAHGDWATFDVKANSVVMGGKVTLKQGRTVLDGTALHMNTLTGEVVVKSEAGTPALGPALGAIAQPKSAIGPGGLPAIQAAVPAPPPAQTNGCAAGRQCLTLFPEDHKKGAKEKVEKLRPKADGWLPQTSPSPVYKAP